MRLLFVLFCFLTEVYSQDLFALVDLENLAQANKNILISTKRIELEQFPGAFNPSIIQFESGYLLTFRYCPDPYSQPDLNYIGVVLLDDAFNLRSAPQLLNTRPANSKTPSQAEDARIFSYRGRLFLIYNDNMDIPAPQTWERRDMHIAELFYENNRFSLSFPLKLIYEEKYQTQWWQKNWIPFEWKEKLLLIYSITPHEVIYPNFLNGSCYHCYDTFTSIDWQWGPLRGSTPAQLIDGEYLAFFHSGIKTASAASWGWDLWHYFMGAYTFAADPPFNITQISPIPIVGENFYTQSFLYKRVIFPGGFVVSGSKIHVAYGKDDCEIWIATLNKEILKKSMISIKSEGKK